MSIATANPHLAAQAHSWNPLSIDPLLTQAALEGFDGRALEALRLYRRATDTQPENPQAWVERGLFELDSLREPCSAYRSLSRAYALDRYNRAVATIGDFLWRVTEPVLRPIRRVIPDLGGIDISPVILILLLWFLRDLMFEYLV